MRTLTIATLALSLLGSSAAFADTIQVGTAHQPPVFATVSGKARLWLTQAPLAALRSSLPPPLPR
jgi:hypothetical protein